MNTSAGVISGQRGRAWHKSAVQPVATIMEEMISEFKETAAQLSSLSS